MFMSKGYIELIFTKYIQRTPKGAIVRDMTIKLSSLTHEVRHSINFLTSSVHITTKVIKKNYDKRPAEENDFMLHHGWRILRNPDSIYLNKDGKRADYVFTKRLYRQTYMAAVEVSDHAEAPMLYVVSMYRLPKPDNYLRSYELIWSRKGGRPSS